MCDSDGTSRARIVLSLKVSYVWDRGAAVWTTLGWCGPSAGLDHQTKNQCGPNPRGQTTLLGLDQNWWSGPKSAGLDQTGWSDHLTWSRPPGVVQRKRALGGELQ